MDRPAATVSPWAAPWFIGAGVLAIASQALVPDGVPRATAAVLIYVAITAAVGWGIQRNGPPARTAWKLIALAMALFTIDFAAWMVEEADRATGAAQLVQDYARLLATLALLGSIGMFIRHHRIDRKGAALGDTALIVAGGGLMLWQWFVLVEGANSSDLIARVGVPLVLAGLAIALGVVAARILGITFMGSTSMLLLFGATAMALAAQGALTLTDSAAGPARWTDATWLAAGVLVAAAALHPSMACDREPAQQWAQVATRLFVVGTVLLANPAIVFMHLLQPDANRRVVLAVAAAAGVVTVLAIWRVARLVAELGRMRSALTQSEERYRSLVQHASDVVAVIDPQGVLTYVSPASSRVLGEAAADLVGTRLADLAVAEDAAPFAAFLSSVLTGPAHGTNSAQVTMTHRAGPAPTVDVVAVNLLSDPAVRGVVVTMRDVTERAAFEARLRHLASHDALTGLANRVLFSDRVAHALERSERQGTLVGVVFIDLDDFKTVNDSLGHLAGDAVLRRVSMRLTEVLRSADTAARLGGDEFAVLLEDLRDTSDATAIVERMRTHLHEPMMLEGRHMRIGATMGVALGGPGSSAEELLRNADTAMFNAKDAGKGRYEVFEPAMHAAALARFDRKADLQNALERGQFELHYQPIYSLADGSVGGVEALLRWRHPRRGLVLPEDFIGLLEETGQIFAIGRWVLGQAFAQARSWERNGGSPAPWISVNLSVRQFHHEQLVDEVAAAVAASGVDPARVVIEITESVFIEDTRAAVRQLDRLKGLGVRLAIDDFGTGYSALSYLQTFRADIVKVDKSFVHMLGGRPDAHTLTSGIIELAGALDIITVAEGVEDAGQVIDLRDIACDFAQGYHLARPMPADRIDALLSGAERAPEPVAGP